MGICAEQAWRSGIDADVETVSPGNASIHVEANGLSQAFVGAFSKH